MYTVKITNLVTQLNVEIANEIYINTITDTHLYQDTIQ
jgi:hypothetical protein